MKQDYELVLNNRTIGSFSKCREGLDQAYRRAEELSLTAEMKLKCLPSIVFTIPQAVR